MANLTKDQIIGCADQVVHAEEVPEWGGTVYLREMTGAERDTWEKLVEQWQAGKVANLASRILILTMCDAAGSRLFADDDVDALAGKNGRVIARLSMAAATISAVDDGAVEDAVNELKNGRSSSSGTD